MNRSFGVWDTAVCSERRWSILPAERKEPCLGSPESELHQAQLRDKKTGCFLQLLRRQWNKRREWGQFWDVQVSSFVLLLCPFLKHPPVCCERQGLFLYPLSLCSETPAPKGLRENESACSCRLPPDLAKGLWSSSGLRNKTGKRSKHTDLAVPVMMRPPMKCLGIPEVLTELSAVRKWLLIHLLPKWFCVHFTCRVITAIQMNLKKGWWTW